MDLQGPQERLCSCSRCSPRPAGTKWEPKPYDHKHARAPKDAGDASRLTPVRFPSHSLLFPCSSSPVWLVSPDKPRHPVGVKADWPPANCFFPEKVPGLLQTIASLLPLITFFWGDQAFRLQAYYLLLGVEDIPPVPSFFSVSRLLLFYPTHPTISAPHRRPLIHLYTTSP